MGQNSIDLKTSLLCKTIDGQFLNKNEDYSITSLSIDSRTSKGKQEEAFFALQGNHLNGHDFIQELYAKGTRTFIISREVYGLPEANIILVDSVLTALQKLAKYKREVFTGKTIGITGSNGKTIVKEWLATILDNRFKVIKSPGSYNSQIGVALSLWQLDNWYEIGILEAGISEPGEMGSIQKMVKPEVGIFTNIGPAHQENFISIEDKVIEKLRLFKDTKSLIVRADDDTILNIIKEHFNGEIIAWAFNLNRDGIINVEHSKKDISFKIGESNYVIKTHFRDEASLENLVHSSICSAYFGLNQEEIQQGVNLLYPLKMRLQVIKGINDNYLIDDSYTNDFGGLTKAIDFMEKQSLQKSKTVILSDFGGQSLDATSLDQLIKLLEDKGIKRFIGIGKIFNTQNVKFSAEYLCFEDTSTFLKDFQFDQLVDQLILIKGSRKFEFERIVNRLSQKLHKTSLEIDLDSVIHNLTTYRKRLKPNVKTMAMVKALAYGAGSFEIAKILEYHKVDYLAVAYTDEGKELREKGIQLPIMVMNPNVSDGPTLAKYDLEPEVFNLEQIETFEQDFRFLGKSLPVHLIINTGMNRLGFDIENIDNLNEVLSQQNNIEVKSIFTHLAAADEEVHRAFTIQQANRFREISSQIKTNQYAEPIHHILNSSGIMSFPEYQMDMVRLGIGLYGLDPTNSIQRELMYPSTFKTTISQIRSVNKGESIGYGRNGVVNNDKTIATIAVGYADGYSRRFGNGKAQVMINGKLAPTIGNICMDMSMVDITDLDASVGDEVILFGTEPTIQDLAKIADTIPYEILTNVSSRVKRVFYAE